MGCHDEFARDLQWLGAGKKFSNSVISVQIELVLKNGHAQVDGLRGVGSREIVHKEGWVAGVKITLRYMHRRSAQET